jgi:hypothetical protein
VQRRDRNRVATRPGYSMVPRQLTMHWSCFCSWGLIVASDKTCQISDLVSASVLKKYYYISLNSAVFVYRPCLSLNKLDVHLVRSCENLK